MAEKFIIAADRARLKIYRFAQAPGQFTPSIQPVNAIELLDRKQPYPPAENTFALRFGGHRGRGGSLSAGEGLPEAETEESLSPAELTDQITAFLEKHPEAIWDLAVPGSLRDDLLEALPEEVRLRLDQVVTKDLVNVTPMELRAHFAL